jgi:hypothetical protein
MHIFILFKFKKSRNYALLSMKFGDPFCASTSLIQISTASLFQNFAFPQYICNMFHPSIQRQVEALFCVLLQYTAHNSQTKQ